MALDVLIYSLLAVDAQILSRSKPAAAAGGGATGTSTSPVKERKKKKLPKLDDFLQNRDYVGAITLLDVRVIGSLACQPLHNLVALDISRG